MRCVHLFIEPSYRSLLVITLSTLLILALLTSSSISLFFTPFKTQSASESLHIWRIALSEEEHIEAIPTSTCYGWLVD